MGSFGLPAINEEELVAASVLCVLTGFALSFFSHRSPVAVVSGLGGLLFGLFCLNEIVPQFGDDGILCLMAGAWVSAIGVVVGCTVAVLLTWASVGTCLGCLAGIFLVLLDGGMLIKAQAEIWVLFAVLIAAGIAYSWYQLKPSMIIMTSSAGALLMACGTDLALDRSMIKAVGRILQMRWVGARHCSWGECQLPALLLEWAVLTVIGVAVQGHASGVLSPLAFLQRLGLFGGVNPYTRVGGASETRASAAGGAAAGALSSSSPAAGGAVGGHGLGGIGGGGGGIGDVGAGSSSGMAAAMALAAAAAGGANARVSGKRKTWTYSENHSTWNYFDMEALPNVFCANKDAIFIAAEALANTFGFQDDNVRNQVEHLLTLLANHRRYANEMPALSLGEGSLPPKSAVHSLHGKLFLNYRDWCESMRIAPNFMPLPTSYGSSTDKAEEDALVVDLMMWLCMWGEAGNLRHMPECLCYLFHKMMQDYHAMLGMDCPALYGGYFLDHVVTPLYEVVTRGKKARADHDSTLNYDDYNEFFWTPTCLMFSYRSDDNIHLDDEDTAEEGMVGAGPPPPPSGVIPIAVGLESTPKTFCEKRSVLSTVLCFQRVLEFHILTFQLSAVVAFGSMMVWDTPYFLQMASTVFWSVNFLGIVWTTIEAWQAYPGIQMTGTAKVGLLSRLCMRFLLLVYQSLYFMWSTQRIEHPHRTGMQAQGNWIFWWWQYLWISVFTMVPYVLESLQQIIPTMSTWLAMCDNDYLQALMNICYPLSRVYVAKRVDEPFSAALKYIFFWTTLLAWKLYFSYKYEVVILVLPTVELYDDYVNYPDTSYWGMFFLILLRWIPQMFIYLIDTTIWFACWSAMTGSVVGFQEKLGEVRDFPSIRKNFMQIPAVFCSKVICPGPSSRDPSALDISAVAVLAKAKGLGAGGDGGGGDKGPLQGEAMLNEASRLLSKVNKPDGRRHNHPREFVREFLDLRTQKWATFAAVWNEVINNMRHSDVISNAEQAILKFHSFVGFAKPVYLPIFQTAGSVDLAVNMIGEHVELYEAEEEPSKKGQHEAALRRAISADVTVEEALSEVWELGVWLIRQLLGGTHDDDMGRLIKAFNEYINGTDAMRHLKLKKIQDIVADTTAIVSALHHALPKRKPLSTSSAASPRQASSPSGKQGAGKRSPAAAGGGGGGSGNMGTGQILSNRAKGGSMTKSVSTSGLSLLGGGSGGSGGGGGVRVAGGVSSGLATEGRRQGMVGAHNSSSAGMADKTRDQVRDKLRPLFNSIRSMVKHTDERGNDLLGRLSFMTHTNKGFMWDDDYASGRLDRMSQDKTTLSILEKLHGLLGIDRNDAEPHSVEARRRLAFFTNSLFMDMPRAPPVGDMMSWSCVTPFYSEDVVYSRDDLEQKNEDGLTTLMYLQALYKHDWRNFMERKGITSEQQAMSKRHIEATRLWASFRAQTLARTVEGIMYYEAALRLLARLERIREEQLEELVMQKFQYVVACQVYGRMKKNQDPKADDIEMLLARFPNLRVAYIDEVRVSRDSASPSMEYFSVLIKSAKGGAASGSASSGSNRGFGGRGGAGGGAGGRGRNNTQEVYRVKLPGNPVVGEGKPENQNHALIFTRGEHLQAIDMNQEGYFEEALKMRCLLEEFRRGTPRRPAVIVGFREHIFTGSVSSLANYMALQELSFVTLGQRVLNNPLRVRMHYGHPDLFDKVFFMAAGGVSKASKGINLSEDIFAGYNGTLRGGQIFFREYVQVGKGRDVGMQQIYKFEAKLSQGAAEQTLSRDVNRLGARLDFFRLMSFYFGGLGYYVGNFITVLTVTFVVYFVLAMAVFNEESIGDRKLIPEGNLQMMLAGMGLLNTMPMLATLTVEKGLLAALGEVLQVFLSGGPMYFMFHIQTRAHYFYQTLLAGGAHYRATGRGFVTHHSCFDDLYRFFANSHFYLGFELMMALLVTAAMTTSDQYFGMTWSLWLACLSFLFAPFWFNPLSFHWRKVVQDYKMWVRWMTGIGGNSSNSWEVWWREENSYLLRFSMSQKLQGLFRPLIYVVIGYGIGAPQLMGLDHKELKVVAKLAALVAALILASVITQAYGSRLSPWVRRSSTILNTTFAVVYGCYLLVAHTKYAKVAVGLYYVVAALSTVGLQMGFKFAKYTWHMHDFIIGHFLFVILFLLSALQFPSTVQTWLLFHNALSEGVVIDDILKYARMNKELAGVDEDLLDGNGDLRKLVQMQAAELEILKQKIIAVGGGQAVGFDGQQQQGGGGAGGGVGGGGVGAAGSVSATPSGGLSYLMQPLGGDGPGSSLALNRAEMMRPSKSTLDLAEMANTKSSNSTELPQSQAFQFNSPASMPPR